MWRPLVVEFRPLDGDAPEAGGTIVETVTFFGRRYTTVYEVEDARPSAHARTALGPGTARRSS